MRAFSYALIGYGQRGKFYVDYIKRKYPQADFSGLCDIAEDKIELAKRNYSLKNEQCFLTEDEFFAQGKIADVLIISSMDQDHYRQAVKALNLGYNLILEKPIAQSARECREIAELANEKNLKVYVCHVLRYAPVYTKIKEMLTSGEFGEVVTISQTEHVGWWHQAHSYVRGNWRRSEQTTPMIVAKCCHDLDLFVWLLDKKCEKVSSFGSLTHFVRANAPEGSADYCFKCSLKDSCLYNCLRFYTKYPAFAFASGQYLGDGEDKKAIEECFSKETNPYARCVYKCDNNVVDHQVVNALFENGVTAQLTMTAFAEGGRTMKVHCTKGIIEASLADETIRYEIYGDTYKEIKVTVEETFGGHGGGDEKLVQDIIEDLFGDTHSLGLTSVDRSVMSHLMGFAAEESRVNGGNVVEIQNF